MAATHHIEQQAATVLPPHILMQRAGLSIARLTLALAPHAECIWIACGPGNNGGDGFEAAMNLHQWGKTVVVTWTGVASNKSESAIDAHTSRLRAMAVGVKITEQPPKNFDFCIDALLGIGSILDPNRSGTKRIQQWLQIMYASQACRLAVDIATGLNADTGHSTFSNTSNSIASEDRAHHLKRLFTLSLLTLKPGLFTAQGRDLSGEVWFDDLEVNAPFLKLPNAWLLGADRACARPKLTAPHAAHKGSFGDVAIVGGEFTPDSCMGGAALLAARAALHSGAGRVFVALLGNSSSSANHSKLMLDPNQPELMFRQPKALDFKHQVVVCGCGGGEAVKEILSLALSTATQLVLDADALNAIASDNQFQIILQARDHKGHITVLTPHPLEAARLLGITTAQVQFDRLMAAQKISEKFRCVVVLKGSGTVVSDRHQLSHINFSGNALLATAGTGDVLAGMLGAYIASGLSGFDAACSAVFAHGRRADVWAIERPYQTLSAGALATFSGVT